MNIRDEVYKHLNEIGSISRLEALGLYNCYDISTVVRDLKSGTKKRLGLDINTEMKQDRNGKVYARYSL
jgi:hypothetical protein